MTKDEALKLALEALETCGEDEWVSDDDYGIVQVYDDRKVNEALAAIQEALAQDEQEPVLNGWRLRDVYFDADGEPSMHRTPKQEPRNFCSRCGKRTPDLTTIHTCTPPRGLEMT